MNQQTRAEIVKMYKEQRAKGDILVGVGAGTGITAKSSERGGADMLIIYNSGRYRMAGRGSLAGLLSYGDAVSYTHLLPQYPRLRGSACAWRQYRHQWTNP